MLTGGYQILDFKGVAFNTSGTYIPNAFYLLDKINKVILISGLKIGGNAYRDCFTIAEKVGDNYVFNAYGYKFTVASTNYISAVTVSDALYEHCIYINHKDGESIDDENRIYFNIITRSPTALTTIESIVQAVNKYDVKFNAWGFKHIGSYSSYKAYLVNSVTIKTTGIDYNYVSFGDNGEFNAINSATLNSSTTGITITDIVRTI